ncbi:hypothetical protein Svir_14110 [Saccharomonospora viridis DSM 43017]|uniref:Uncharacterized protein n=1 Tax=Saccharomonospora viridis (strain ATCC 15386 / DSM 43017 / JCM 3036 / CCUG 5913 / NBRC 12207 / NCIMB 9602 / P101) TaxID=471857 RepID=C7MQF3_SACVD|nr:hypothetical protein Svir_14110 [Saccharomonospora viridis DSM 43017]
MTIVFPSHGLRDERGRFAEGHGILRRKMPVNPQFVHSLEIAEIVDAPAGEHLVAYRV